VTTPPRDRLPLVVVPGLGLAAEVYAGLAAALTGAAGPLERVDTVHLPGYGRPAPRGADLSPPALARLVLAETARLGLPRFALLGHSSSCQVVTEVAAAAPERVPALVLVGPTTDPRAAGWVALAGRWLATARHERPGQAPLLLRVYARTGLRSMARAMDASRRHRVAGTARDLPLPALVVRGRHDRIAPADWVALLASRTGGRAVTLPVGAHMVPVTHPGHLAAVVEPWRRAASPHR
jgi:pimeloyl-ACP methyl ester carboxylesterase